MNYRKMAKRVKTFERPNADKVVDYYRFVKSNPYLEDTRGEGPTSLSNIKDALSDGSMDILISQTLTMIPNIRELTLAPSSKQRYLYTFFRKIVESYQTFSPAIAIPLQFLQKVLIIFEG